MGVKGFMGEEKKILHNTESVCPVCLGKIPAKHIEFNGDVYLQKTCSDHGEFCAVIWRGEDEPSYESWNKAKLTIRSQDCITEVEKGCPYDCGICPEHRQQTCCVLLEVTERCNLNCNFCFARSGGDKSDPSFEKIRQWMGILEEAGKPFIHLSGGEPTVREDLPEIIQLAKEMGFPYIQLNTNGLRLALEPNYAKRLKDAGLSSVFMQFDGTRDDIYESLRGRALLDLKKKAIENCGNSLLGVVLVPTLVPGVNADNIGEIIKFGLNRAPDVRGIHFQPVSYFGRYPDAPLDSQRITLPEVLREIERQTTGIFKIKNFLPSGCDHARCGFHGDFVVMPNEKIRSLTRQNAGSSCCSKDGPSAVEKNRNFVARRWERKVPVAESTQKKDELDFDDLDTFIERVRSHGFTVTGMAFQDCWNLDLERLQECSLHVLSTEGRIIPFCAYNLSSLDGKGLYRGGGERP